MLATDYWLLTTLRHPCFCLCFTFVQITRTTPLRRTILQFSQILLTLARTFIIAPEIRRIGYLIMPSQKAQLPSDYNPDGGRPSVRMSTPVSVIATVCSK